MCASYVYKRRKLRNSVALLQKQSAEESSNIQNRCNSGLRFGYEHQLYGMNKANSDRTGAILHALVNGADHIQVPSNSENFPISLLNNQQIPITKSGLRFVHEHHLFTAKTDDLDSLGQLLPASINGVNYNTVPPHTRNSPVSLTSDPQNATECISRISGEPATIVSIDDQKLNLSNRVSPVAGLTSIESGGDGSVVLALTTVPEAVNGFPIPYKKIYRRKFPNKPKISLLDHKPLANESLSSNLGVEDTSECSSSEHNKHVEVQSVASSSKQFCINVLKSSGLIGGVWPLNNDASLEVVGGVGTTFHRQCKVCGVMQNPTKMLICDLCEEAFHLSCAQVKELPGESWYCQPCARKNPKPLLDAAYGKIFPTIGEEYKRKILKQELGPIQFMLLDSKPHTSNVRIGSEFQAEVPEWSGPVSDYSSCFGEPSVVDPLECCNMSKSNSQETRRFNVENPLKRKTMDLTSTKSSKPSSIGNWIQCRQVIYDDKDDKDEGFVCGKWRRAPLFVNQTNDWDCSCCVVWDPFHADCAVPQELETDEVLKHLRYVELLRTRVNKQKKSG